MLCEKKFVTNFQVMHELELGKVNKWKICRFVEDCVWADCVTCGSTRALLTS